MLGGREGRSPETLRLKESFAAFAAVGRNANLRWLELSWTASVVGHYAYLIAVSVYAYDVGGEGALSGSSSSPA